MQKYRCNGAIRASQVRLIGEHGEQVGIVPIQEAIQRARSVGLDLVEISPNVAPPVCKVMDFGKFTYQQSKREKEHKKAQIHTKQKEIRFSYNIDANDLKHKIAQSRNFLEEGHSVRISCILRGRQLQFAQDVLEKFKNIEEELSDIATVDVSPKLEGKMVVSHFKARKKESKSA